jgi:hypothetical protein
MKLHIALLLALAMGFFTITKCAPATSSNDTAHTLHKRINDCDYSSFNEWLRPAPLADCQKIYDNIVGSGTWSIKAMLEKTIVSYKGCGLTVYNHEWVDWIYIGNDDIRDLIRESIARYNDGHNVTAKGDVWCKSSLVGVQKALGWELGPPYDH